MMWFRNYEIYDDTGLSFISMPGLCSIALVCMENNYTFSLDSIEGELNSNIVTIAI